MSLGNQSVPEEPHSAATPSGAEHSTPSIAGSASAAQGNGPLLFEATQPGNESDLRPSQSEQPQESIAATVSDVDRVAQHDSQAFTASGPADAARKSRAPAIRSLSNSIHDIANTVLYGAGFTERQIEAADVVEILRFLEDCREEGRALYPEILLTTSLRDCLEGIHPLKLILSGECSDRPGRFRRALKKCAAIVAEPWVVVIEVCANKVNYGFASSALRADSSSLYDSLIETHIDATRPPFLFIRRFGSRAVWLRSPKEEHVISLTLSEELLRANEHIESFAKLIVEDVSLDVREKTYRLVTRLLQESCREGHGFISCVIKGDESTAQACQSVLTDGSWLRPPLSLASFTLDEANAAAALESESAVRANALLARQMVQMDLMTVFSTSAAVVGYNIHIPSARAARAMTGGARTRAFAALAEVPSLRGAFMCSQDGLTSYQEF